MEETTFLNGKVRKQSLPLFRQPPPAGTEGPRRLLLPQGELANFYNADEGVRYLALIEMRPGAVRGNHLHRVKEEYVYIISGEVLLVVQDESGARVSVPAQAGDLLVIATGIGHVLKPLTTGLAVEFSKAKFDPADSERVAIL
jgi:mannose-6-phosphate isomerase-like protein (cupin superfamily)